MSFVSKTDTVPKSFADQLLIGTGANNRKFKDLGAWVRNAIDDIKVIFASDLSKLALQYMEDPTFYECVTYTVALNASEILSTSERRYSVIFVAKIIANTPAIARRLGNSNTERLADTKYVINKYDTFIIEQSVQQQTIKPPVATVQIVVNESKFPFTLSDLAIHHMQFYHGLIVNKYGELSNPQHTRIDRACSALVETIQKFGNLASADGAKLRVREYQIPIFHDLTDMPTNIGTPKHVGYSDTWIDPITTEMLIASTKETNND